MTIVRCNPYAAYGSALANFNNKGTKMPPNAPASSNDIASSDRIIYRDADDFSEWVEVRGEPIECNADRSVIPSEEAVEIQDLAALQALSIYEPIVNCVGRFLQNYQSIKNEDDGHLKEKGLDPVPLHERELQKFVRGMCAELSKVQIKTRKEIITLLSDKDILEDIIDEAKKIKGDAGFATYSLISSLGINKNHAKTLIIEQLKLVEPRLAMISNKVQQTEASNQNTKRLPLLLWIVLTFFPSLNLLSYFPK